MNTSVFAKRKKNLLGQNNRLHIVMAIIFLLVVCLIVKLYSLQVIKYDLYTALASDQHQVYSKLEPNRGRIFLNDLDDGVYPVATNKEFGSVYAVPKEIEKPEEISERLYEIFNKEEVESEVDELLLDDKLFASSSEYAMLAPADLEEFKNIKREKEIELRKDEIIEAYVNKLSKEDDPYEPIREKVDEEKLAMIQDLDGIDYVMETYRYYPGGDMASHLLGFVRNSQSEMVGSYGLEGFFNEELTGKFGSIYTEKSAQGKLIIINDRNYVKPEDGSDMVLTLNRSIQFMVCDGLREAVEKHQADGGIVVVMSPDTGAILAMCSFPDYDPNTYSQVDDVNIYNNPAIFDAYEPGSVFKTVTIATGIENGEIEPNSLYEDKGYMMIQGWDKPIKNSDFETHGPHGWVDMNTVLSESLNTGTMFIENKIGHDLFSEYVMKFGFGDKTGIELETESAGNIDSLRRSTKRDIELATASFGQGISATALQMAASYAAIANGGILMKPYVVDEIIHPDGKREKTQPVQIRRVVSERTALLTSGMLVNVVDGGHAKLAGVPGYYVAGKTGTAQVAAKGGYGDKTIHTFVGFAPVDNPKFVMLVRLDDPKDVEYSASSAAPLFGEFAKFILDYYKVPTER